MKRIVTILLAFILSLCGPVPALAAEDAQSGEWRYTVSEGKAVVTGYLGKAVSVVVPEELGGHPVTEIGTAAFYRAKITAVTLPASVRKIGWWAFYGADKLSEVKLAPGLQTICFGAFLNCASLRSVALPSTVYSIGEDAFAVSCTTKTGVEDVNNDRTVGQQFYSVNYAFVLRGYRGTAAEQYAAAHNLAFEGDGTLSFGDINADGTIDKRDIVLLESSIDGASLSETERLSADLNADGKTDAADLVLLRAYVSGEISLRDLPAARFKPAEQNYLYGKRLYSDGDSVAKGTGTDTFGNGFHSYAHYLSEKYGMALTTRAIGGTTLARVKDNPITSEGCILDRVLGMKGDYDVILLDGGFNDMFIDAPLGAVTADADRSGKYNAATTAGALETICYFLNTHYPDAVKLFVLCHDCLDDAQPLYFDTLRAVLDKWDVPYVDVSAETDFRAVNTEINNQYFFCNDSKPKGDRIHPLAYAQDKVYGALIEQKLNSLFAERNRLAAESEKLSVAKGERIRVSLQEGEQPYVGDADWTSSEEETVSVSDGVLTANNIGEATVRAETPDGQITAVQVDVKQYPLCFYLNWSTATLRRTQQLSLVPEFLEGTASGEFSFSSSDASIAEVSDGGTITARAGGTAIITCKLSNGVKTTCMVVVRGA